eukprot:1158278-Pelagomonas_calceolata.AAC.1
MGFAQHPVLLGDNKHGIRSASDRHSEHLMDYVLLRRVRKQSFQICPCNAPCPLGRKARKGRGYIAVPACRGSLAGTKKNACNLTKPVQKAKVTSLCPPIFSFPPTRKGECYTTAPAYVGSLAGVQFSFVYMGVWPSARWFDCSACWSLPHNKRP